VSGLVVGVGVGLFVLFGAGQAYQRAGGPGGIGGILVFGLGVGLFAGLGSGLLYGGATVLQHYTLRWLLYRNDYLPLRLVPFLDYCTERIFLRPVGGGYIFVHRLLMEHFASLHEKPAED
jgi:hypothetical protein